MNNKSRYLLDVPEDLHRQYENTPLIEIVHELYPGWTEYQRADQEIIEKSKNHIMKLYLYSYLPLILLAVIEFINPSIISFPILLFYPIIYFLILMIVVKKSNYDVKPGDMNAHVIPNYHVDLIFITPILIYTFYVGWVNPILAFIPGLISFMLIVSKGKARENIDMKIISYTLNNKTIKFVLIPSIYPFALPILLKEKMSFVVTTGYISRMKDLAIPDAELLKLHDTYMHIFPTPLVRPKIPNLLRLYLIPTILAIEASKLMQQYTLTSHFFGLLLVVLVLNLVQNFLISAIYLQLSNVKYFNRISSLKHELNEEDIQRMLRDFPEDKFPSLFIFFATLNFQKTSTRFAQLTEKAFFSP